MPSSPAASTPQPDGGRRSVLNWLLGTWSTGVIGSIVFPVLRYPVPPEIPEATTLSVKAGPAWQTRARADYKFNFDRQPLAWYESNWLYM